jgi:hypothetical protein
VLDGTKLALSMLEVKLRTVFWFAATHNETGDGNPGSAPIQNQFKPLSLKGSPKRCHNLAFPERKRITDRRFLRIDSGK